MRTASVHGSPRRSQLFDRHDDRNQSPEWELILRRRRGPSARRKRHLSGRRAIDFSAASANTRRSGRASLTRARVRASLLLRCRRRGACGFPTLINLQMQDVLLQRVMAGGAAG